VYTYIFIYSFGYPCTYETSNKIYLSSPERYINRDRDILTLKQAAEHSSVILNIENFMVENEYWNVFSSELKLAFTTKNVPKLILFILPVCTWVSMQSHMICWTAYNTCTKTCNR